MKKATALQSFFQKHCHSSHYVFQIRKCTDKSCNYCAGHPITLPSEVFREHSFLPLPLLDQSKEHYRKFADVFGQTPNEKDHPSYVPTPSDQAKQRDQEHKGIVVKAKVRTVVCCGECHKPGCVYANSKLSPHEKAAVDCMKETKTYTCGSLIFSEGTPLASTVIVIEALVCASSIEAQYYNAVLVHFPPVCYYCGLGEESLVDDDEMRKLRTCYAVVLPLCFLCKSEGKSPKCKKPSNVAKRAKTL